MKKHWFGLLALATLVLVSPKAYSQYYYYNDRHLDKDVIWEVGAQVGIMNCMTDLGKKGFNTTNSNLSGGFYAGFLYQNFIGARLEFNWGRIEAADSLAGKGSPQYNRNLSFRSNINEISIIGEFHPFMLAYKDNMPSFSPYLLAGYTYFQYNPQAYLNGKWINLQPLSTEGQGFEPYKSTREKYNLGQTAIPVGIGFKYELSQRINLRAEFMYRFTSTDYLDDVSSTYIDPALFDQYLSPQQAAWARALHYRSPEVDPTAPSTPSATNPRGSANSKDAYWGLQFKIGINLGRDLYH
ncbi:MAG TPA: hypothetical protein DCL43_10205 [Chitinophagaceae bacterium]|jgi:hypothetical protein|nr:hypothetical protein [Chitinophagaceae bacterium]HAN37331.1 hypothetical protein [Chitinophagaceae bacterium]